MSALVPLDIAALCPLVCLSSSITLATNSLHQIHSYETQMLVSGFCLDSARYSTHLLLPTSCELLTCLLTALRNEAPTSQGTVIAVCGRSLIPWNGGGPWLKPLEQSLDSGLACLPSLDAAVVPDSSLICCWTTLHLCRSRPSPRLWKPVCTQSQIRGPWQAPQGCRCGLAGLTGGAQPWGPGTPGLDSQLCVS